MNYKILEGKRGIIFGALDERSIAWKVAEKCNEAGASFVLTNAPIALRMGTINELAHKTGSEIIPCDVSVDDDMKNLIEQSMQKLGGKLDFILHSVGMSFNIRKKHSYTELDYELMKKTLDVSAISFHRLLQTCYNLDALKEWSSVVALTYIAAQRVFPNYNEMADTKALLESITRSMGFHYGKKKKVRINTISQSPTFTSAGSGVGGFDSFLSYSEKMSPLGNASADECAEYCVVMFSDYTKMVTMQNLFHDGGYSFTGASEEVLNSMGI